jgi:hypothetical protein
MLDPTPWQTMERVIFLLCLIVFALDMYYWRP